MGEPRRQDLEKGLTTGVKHGTENKLKFRVFKKLMRMPLWQVKGVLQSIWDFTAENAMDGAIGRFTDAQIALGIEYDGDADKLIKALVESGWLDRSRSHRLVIHDWSDHCEDWVRKRLKRSGAEFARGDAPRKSQSIDNNQFELFTADNGGRRRTTADNGGLPNPNPDPGPIPDKPPIPPCRGKPADAGGAPAWDWQGGFTEFWGGYPPECPRKAEKAKCAEFYHREVKNEGGHALLMRALAIDKGGVDWQKEGGRFINAPLVWLRKRRWLDDLDERTGHVDGAMVMTPARQTYEHSDDDLRHKHREFMAGLGCQGEDLERAMVEYDEQCMMDAEDAEESSCERKN